MPTRTPLTATSTMAERIDRLAGYLQDWAEIMDPYTAGWSSPFKYNPGTWITPRRDSGLALVGQPHVVLVAQQPRRFEYVYVGNPGTRWCGWAPDMVVACINGIVPMTVLGQAVDFEPYVFPPGISKPVLSKSTLKALAAMHPLLPAEALAATTDTPVAPTS